MTGKVKRMSGRGGVARYSLQRAGAAGMGAGAAWGGSGECRERHGVRAASVESGVG